MRIFWRQFLPSFLIISVVLILFTIFTIVALKKHDKSLTKQRLLTTASLLSEVVESSISEGKIQKLSTTVSQIDKKTGIRITVIDNLGVVISDSEKDPKFMENHAERPELKDAVSKGIGESIRYSTTVKKEMFYVAVPVADNKGNKIALVRTALPLISFEETFESIRSEVIYLGLILTLLALLVSFAFSKAFSKSFERSIRLSEEIAKGNFNVTIPISERKGEMGKLNLSLKAMAEKLDELFRQVSIEKSQLEAVLTAMSEGVMVVA
ncbi:MAG: HAMP domain-containing protein, partial [Thermodesulfobacteriota bacterium]